MAILLHIYYARKYTGKWRKATKKLVYCYVRMFVMYICEWCTAKCLEFRL